MSAPDLLTKCERCDKNLMPGETAYVQTWREIVVNGTRARMEDRHVVVCEDCA